MALENILFQLFNFTSQQGMWELNLWVILITRFFFLGIQFLYRKLYPFEMPLQSRVISIAKELGLGIFFAVDIRLTVFFGIYQLMAFSFTLNKLTQAIISNSAGIGKIRGLLMFIVILFGALIPIILVIFGLFSGFLLESLVGLISMGIFIGKHKYNPFILLPSSIEKKPNTTEFRDTPTPVQKVLALLILILCPSFLIALSFGSVERELVYITTTDGMQLASYVYKPRVLSQPLPVMLIRTPYNQDHLIRTAHNWASQGFIVVTQDMRGTFLSGGEFHAFMDEFMDGNDTINWIMAQPWCNGKIGSLGMSAGAVNQYLFAGANPKGLLAQKLDMGTGDIYDLFFTGGVYRKAIAEGFVYQGTIVPGWLTLNAPDMIEVALAHAQLSEWWQNGSLAMNNRYANVSARGLHFGGWYDIFVQGTIDGYLGYSQNGTDYAQDHQKLIMGPWHHGSSRSSGKCGDVFVNFPDGGDPIGELWQEQLFAENLQNLDPFSIPDYNTLWNGTNVAYYTMGDLLDPNCAGNRWNFVEDWPVPYETIPYYLTPNQSMQTTIPTTTENFSYIADPNDPILTLGGNNLVIPTIGMYNQKPLFDSRTDMLHFTSPTLESPLEVTGRVYVKLYIASNCTDTDFMVKLTDMYPGGEYNLNVMDSAISCRRRNGLSENDPLIPGEVYEVTVDLLSTSYEFNIGHQIQITIASTNYPRFAVCANNFSAPIAGSYSESDMQIANNTILVGADYPSGIYFPIPN